MDLGQVEVRELVARCLTESLLLVAGGSFPEEAEQKRLLETAVSSISFPNNNNTVASGKPHDIEIRLALSLFHRWKREHATPQQVVEVISDMGVTRRVDSPRALADLILLPLESACRREGVAHDVRSQPSGLLCIVTAGRSHVLRLTGKLPCPHCTKWCQGEKGLWWHQQQNHKIAHSEAAEVAASSTDTMAMIPYNPDREILSSSSLIGQTPGLRDGAAAIDVDEPLDYVKAGNLEALKQEVENGYLPAQEMDKKGASPLMWAAGSGHLSIVRYLVEVGGCDPNQPQQGKRSFSGRTALHWAARNGNLDVVEYLVRKCGVDVEAATIDGTTAFCWASWQGHIPIMEFLSEDGADVHTLNHFGCNAVLWAAQGKGDTRIMEWLQLKGCEMTKVNNNGHGVLHKAAQRGQQPVCNWFFDTWIKVSTDGTTALKLVGPDTEGYCPSDLAGMEGHDDLAREIAAMEMDLIENLLMEYGDLPSWLTATQEGISMRVSEKELFTWERFGGQRRMRSRLVLRVSE